MFRLAKGMGRWFAIATAIGLLCAVDAMAAKPPKPPASGPAYTIVPFLPPQFASVRSQVRDLNETGQAVGFAEVDYDAGGYRAVHFSWTSTRPRAGSTDRETTTPTCGKTAR